jgi:hypothetical protein
MYHCDACGWDGAEPVLSNVPSLSTDLLWTLRVCPQCGEEVYETRVMRLPVCSCGEALGHPGPCQTLFSGGTDALVDRMGSRGAGGPHDGGLCG